MSVPTVVILCVANNILCLSSLRLYNNPVWKEKRPVRSFMNPKSQKNHHKCTKHFGCDISVPRLLPHDMLLLCNNIAQHLTQLRLKELCHITDLGFPSTHHIRVSARG